MQQPFKAALEMDKQYFYTVGEKAVMELFAATHTGISQSTRSSWLDGRQHGTGLEASFPIPGSRHKTADNWRVTRRPLSLQ
jgi:hypothetical protein